MVAPITPSRMTRASTYIPVPPMSRVRSHLHGEVESHRDQIARPGHGRLKVADCQLKASGAPRALYGFHRGRIPWCTWVHDKVVQGMISRMRSKTWGVVGERPRRCAGSVRARSSWSKGPSDHPWARAPAPSPRRRRRPPKRYPGRRAATDGCGSPIHLSRSLPLLRIRSGGSWSQICRRGGHRRPRMPPRPSAPERQHQHQPNGRHRRR